MQKPKPNPKCVPNPVVLSNKFATMLRVGGDDDGRRVCCLHRTHTDATTQNTVRTGLETNCPSIDDRVHLGRTDDLCTPGAHNSCAHREAR